MFLLKATGCQVGTRNPLVSWLELQSTPKTIEDIVVAIACLPGSSYFRRHPAPQTKNSENTRGI